MSQKEDNQSFDNQGFNIQGNFDPIQDFNNFGSTEIPSNFNAENELNSEQAITIKVEKVKRKFVSKLYGFTLSKPELKIHLGCLKKKLACGGFVKEDKSTKEIIFQLNSDKVNKIKLYLIKDMDISEDNINIV